MNINERFGAALIEYLNHRGWHSGSRRELSIALLHYAGEAGALDLDSSRFALSMELKVPPSTLETLLRDRMLYFSKPKPYGLDEFLAWIEENNHTALEDAKLHKLVVALRSPAERLSAERFLDEIGYTPDFKNNHRLIVIDLDRLLSALALKLNVKPAGLLEGLNIDRKKLREARDSQKDLLALALQALTEQAGKQIGVATVELAGHLIRRAYEAVKRTNS
jgi:hypothetical protein